MEKLNTAIHSTPIIDSHAHPLLLPSVRVKYPLLSIVSEASGEALDISPSSLPHLRAVKDLSNVLGCPETWDDVVTAVEKETAKPDNVWAKHCMQGIETILLDDGLNTADNEVYDYAWHDTLVRRKCKRIVRIETVAENIINRHISAGTRDALSEITVDFYDAIEDAIVDPEVVGFKSVICYRSGLNISARADPDGAKTAFIRLTSEATTKGQEALKRLADKPLNDYFVHLAAWKISVMNTKHKKPLQFHIGLGDNDLNLTSSSPSHLQDFIRAKPNLPIVLLHGSYPWTKEAGYLASVYANVYADIGLVFPMISRDGQEKVLREILEVCPTEKICWSTDGHWFPTSYLLATMQVKEAMGSVFGEYVQNGMLTTAQAVKAVEDIFFSTSNRLYDLGLSLQPLAAQSPSTETRSHQEPDKEALIAFLDKHPDIKFLRIQYLDYTATQRLRILPIKRVREMLNSNIDMISIGLNKAAVGIDQNGNFAPGFNATGEYRLTPIFSSIRSGPRELNSSVAGELRDGTADMSLCPRTLLRQLLTEAKERDLEFLLGFEIEIVFMSRTADASGTEQFGPLLSCSTQAWSTANALENPEICKVLAEIYDALSAADIHLEQLHPEETCGQFEFVLPPLPPLSAVDTLIQAREIIVAVCANHSLRATMVPKPFPTSCGTASHAHISIASTAGEKGEVYEAFYAGILEHLPAITAFTLPSESSWDRIVDSCYAGSTWVSWGTHNREVQLRKIEGSHWEMKCFDGMANGYLGVAAIIAAGLDGIEKESKLEMGDCQVDPALLNDQERKKLGIIERLPGSVEAALERLQGDQTLIQGMGKELADAYLGVKKTEKKLLEGMNSAEKRQWFIARY